MRTLAALALVAGCAHVDDKPVQYPTVEVRLDDGKPQEKPLTPAKTFEILMRMDPQLPAFTPRKLRFLLAQAGHLVFTLYATTAEGNVGEAIMTVDREYDPKMVSDGKDGRWITEKLIKCPVQRGPLWLGIHNPAQSDARIWASSTKSEAYQRDPDPSVPLSSLKIPRTPLVRLEVVPAQ